MAKVLKTFDFGAARGAKYNWAEILDGKIRQFTVGEDIEDADKFRARVRDKAMRLGIKVRVSMNKAEDGTVDSVVVQAYGKDGEALNGQ